MSFPDNRQRSARWQQALSSSKERLQRSDSALKVEGRLTRIVGLTLEAVGCHAAIGSRCLIDSPNGRRVEAEVVGFSGDRLYLMPIGDAHGILPQSRVIPSEDVYEIPVGEHLLGRIIDGAAKPLDGLGPLETHTTVPLTGKPINPLHRTPITQPLDVGIRAINSLLRVGQGQRLGLFAGSGVGKSVLLGMMTKFTDADVVVVGLIGERGREVQEFVERILGEEGRKRAVVVAAPADNPPLMRLHGCLVATSIAEYFRDQGKNVLLLIDSLTRFAQAQREIALAVGEPPATKGYPPSVFAKLPTLVERAGMGNSATGQGSITAFYTVLAEGDDENDPIVDSARAILDGHIILSRQIADSGRYPAINVESSVSRVMDEITPTEQMQQARRFKQIYSRYQQNRDLITVGAYQAGSDQRVDEAIRLYPILEQFLSQDSREAVSLAQSAEALQIVTGN